MSKINKFLLILLVISGTVFLISCSVSTEDILNIPKKKEADKQSGLPDRKDNLTNTKVFHQSADKVWEAAAESIYWIKWKPFMNDRDNNLLVLKEAYVYENNGSIKRIYNWPPMSELSESELSDYLGKITYTDNDKIIEDTVFTQENMRIKIEELSDNKTEVSVLYEVIPHLKSGDIGNVLNSRNYIESIVLNKIEENLDDPAGTTPVRE